MIHINVLYPGGGMAKRNQGELSDVHRQVSVRCRPNAETQRALDEMRASIDRVMEEVPFLRSSEQSTSLQLAQRKVLYAFVLFLSICLALAIF